MLPAEGIFYLPAGTGYSTGQMIIVDGSNAH